MSYYDAKNKIVQNYSHRTYKAENLRIVLMNEHEDYKKAEEKVRSLVMSLADDDLIDKALEERAAIIKALGYEVADLYPQPLCKKCKDTGLYNGQYCDCVKKFSLSLSSDFVIPKFTFKDSDMNIFADNKDKMENVYSILNLFSEKFPNTKTLNVILTGAVGTGKTSLAAAVANKVNSRGYSVAFTSAFKFNDICLRYHTTFTPDKADLLSPLLESDLLVIDDLGTEPLFKNVTKEYLYNVISERILLEKRTIITTNLNKEKLIDRYEERVISRLFDERICLAVGFNGKDLRK